MARYGIVPERSQVWIQARSSLHPIHSTTEGLEGHIDLELDGEGRVEAAPRPQARLSLLVSRLSSGNRLEDREMQKRIDANRFPSIDGVLSQLEPTGGDGQYRIVGDITFKGVTRSHNGEMTIKAVDDQRIRLAGSSRFDIREFGLEPPRILMLRVEPEVDVRVEILAQKQGEPPEVIRSGSADEAGEANSRA